MKTLEMYSEVLYMMQVASFDYSQYICFIMHIKAFLKKISEMPSSDLVPSSRVSPALKDNTHRKSRASLATFSDKMIASGANNSSNAIKYLNNHHPIIKARLISHS
jgi:hypothetical protein